MSHPLNTLEPNAGEGASLRVARPLVGGSFATNTGATLPFVLPEEQIGPTGEILEPSPDRVAPACAHFTTCGGCHYQHAAYPVQLGFKQEILTSLFAQAGWLDLPEISVTSGPEYGYRNRIRVRLEPDPEGAFHAGYSLPGTNQFLPIRMCPIAAPVLWRAVEAMLHLAPTDALVRRWLAATAELELFTLPDESRLQIEFLLRSADAGKREASSFAGFCMRLESVIPELAGASALLDPELNRRARRAWPGVSWGAKGLLYPVRGRSYWVPRGAFFQVNRFLVDKLVDIVTANRSGQLAWDLYAGVGLFTRALTESFTHIVAVEGGEVAAIALASVKPAPGSARIEPIHAATVEFLRERQNQRERPDLIICDPPRAGLGAEAAEMLIRIAAPNVVYVSCDPVNLMRDLAILTPRYRIASLHMVDLFPQTFHLETIVHLTTEN